MSRFPIVPAHLAVRSMRDSGYKNAAYAVAELIDNALQAGAGMVSVLCQEEEQQVRQRVRRHLKQVAVLDNGSGMDAPTLRQALQFGNGAYLEDRSGIGRFGMGLPSSSLSQAQRVEVWTWQDGIESAVYSYLDLSEIIDQTLDGVPAPKPAAVPDVWRRCQADFGPSGTLVVWSKIDRCSWRTARALIMNSELLIGRIYRRFLHDGRATIRLAAFTGHPRSGFTIDEQGRPNDPMYLMQDSSTPEPWADEPMFEAYGDPRVIEVAHGEQRHSVTIQFAVAKKAAREGHNPGGEPHGRHAKKNVGVSIMRADRELELQVAGWTNTYDPTERWWGCEVDIPAGLDEVFGVTNNKQSATALAEFAAHGLDEIAEREGFDTAQELHEAWSEDGDPRLILVQIKQFIESNLAPVRKAVKVQTQRSKQKRLRGRQDAESKGTEATRKRQQDGYVGSSDADEAKPAEERAAEVKAGFLDAGFDDQEATERAYDVVDDGRKYEFIVANLESPAFFSVQPKGGVLLIKLNLAHPAYEHLVALLEDVPDGASADALRERMNQCYEGLKLLLEAWARFEDELPDGRRKERAQEMRTDWGRVARDFLRAD